MNIEILKTAKKRKKLTLQQIADLSGIPKRTVDQIFSGKTTNPRIDTLEAIQEALGLNSPTLEWTDEDRALGVGKYPEFYSEEEKEWMDLRSLIIENHGKDQYETVATLLEAWAKQKK